MIDEIQHIITECGPRPAGSEAEKKAQQIVQERLLKSTTNVVFEEFESTLTAKFGKLKFYALFYFISLVLYWVSPLWSFVISLVNATILTTDFMCNFGVTDFLFQKTYRIYK